MVVVVEAVTGAGPGPTGVVEAAPAAARASEAGVLVVVAGAVEVGEAAPPLGLSPAEDIAESRRCVFEGDSVDTNKRTGKLRLTKSDDSHKHKKVNLQLPSEVRESLFLVGDLLLLLMCVGVGGKDWEGEGCSAG